LQYAITWYGLALVTIIFFLYYRKKVKWNILAQEIIKKLIVLLILF
jgi:cytochrome oxidase assembly protein ShyY1